MAQLEREGHERKTGFMPTLKRTFKEFSADQVTDMAAALTYYGLMAMFPALIALVGIVGLVFDPAQVTKALTTTVQQLSPGTAGETLKGPIESVTKSKGGSFFAVLLGSLLALSSASGYVGAFMRTSNVMYEVDEGRPIWKLRPLQMLVTLVMVLLLAIGAVIVVASGPLASAIGKGIGVSDTAVTVWNIAKWPVLLLIVTFMISILYYASPNAKLRGFKFVTTGGVLAVVVFLIASALFAFYVANFGSYNKTYGSLGGVIVFLVWLWITNIALLLGNEFNAEKERDRQLAEGTEKADKEIQLPERDAPKQKKRPKTA